MMDKEIRYYDKWYKKMMERILEDVNSRDAKGGLVDLNLLSIANLEDLEAEAVAYELYEVAQYVKEIIVQKERNMKLNKILQ
jgi:hypothetical protein